jgi:uncharacterized membrane protein YfcA
VTVGDDRIVVRSRRRKDLLWRMVSSSMPSSFVGFFGSALRISYLVDGGLLLLLFLLLLLLLRGGSRRLDDRRPEQTS